MAGGTARGYLRRMGVLRILRVVLGSLLVAVWLPVLVGGLASLRSMGAGLVPRVGQALEQFLGKCLRHDDAVLGIFGTLSR